MARRLRIVNVREGNNVKLWRGRGLLLQLIRTRWENVLADGVRPQTGM